MTDSKMMTTGLSEDLISWLAEYSKAKKRTKRSILEEALTRYRFEAKRREFEAGFAKASRDSEIFDLAEMGLEDYNQQLND